MRRLSCGLKSVPGLALVLGLVLSVHLAACSDNGAGGVNDAGDQDAGTPDADAATLDDAGDGDAGDGEDGSDGRDGGDGDAGDGEDGSDAGDGGDGSCPVGDLQMLRIDPDGSFTMGSPEGELGREDEVGRMGDEIQHQVTLNHSYEIGIYEITRAQYEAYMGYVPSTEQLECTDCPVDETTWHEAAAFTNAVSECAGLTPCYDCHIDATGEWICTPTGSPYSCEGYRLPTEAEWEYAARAGVASAYTNGGNLVNAEDEYDLDGNVPLDNGTLLDDICWFRGNSGFQLHPVGQKPPNNWGLYDVIGNAKEWCHDWIASYTADSVVDPEGPPSGTNRVIRGGSFNSSPAYHRLAYRLWYPPDWHIIGGTIRLARTLQ